MKLPDAIIIGAQKCATTGLIYSLNKHPDVWCATLDNYQKAKMTPPGNGGSELHFFSDYWDKGVQWYADWFAPGENSFCIEKSPPYFMCPETPKRIKQVVPDCKLILMVRDPVKRAFSAYNHIQQEKAAWAAEAVGLPFLQAIEAYPKLLGEGRYFENLEHWLQIFPEQQLLIVSQERLTKNPDKEYARILQFLQLPVVPLDNRKVHARQYEGREITAEEVTKLKSYFQPHNAKLFNFLGYSLSEWN